MTKRGKRGTRSAGQKEMKCSILVFAFATALAPRVLAKAESDPLATPNVVRACSESYSRTPTGNDFGVAASNAVACHVVVTKYVDPAERDKGQFASLKICVPETASKEQLARVFVNYADAHPEIWHLTSFEVAMYAFHSAFPCAR